MILKESNIKINEQYLQELAASALYIAAKMEEIYPPPIENFMNTPEQPLDVDNLVYLEKNILNSLNWNCTVPTINN